MSLSFQGPKESFERRWIVYAMLRDNVQHHLEGGTPSAAYAQIHALGDALVEGEISVPAFELRREIELVRGILDRPIGDLAISIRTRAVQTLSYPLPERRNTILVSAVGWKPPFQLSGAHTLRDAFGSLVDELLQITEGAGPGDVVTVIDS